MSRFPARHSRQQEGEEEKKERIEFRKKIEESKMLSEHI
jgi:hypothetical protein